MASAKRKTTSVTRVGVTKSKKPKSVLRSSKKKKAVKKTGQVGSKSSTTVTIRKAKPVLLPNGTVCFVLD